MIRQGLLSNLTMNRASKRVIYLQAIYRQSGEKVYLIITMLYSLCIKFDKHVKFKNIQLNKYH